MLWSSKGVEFSEEDSRLYVENALPQLIKAVGEQLYVSNDGKATVLLESHIQESVESILRAAATTLDTTAIAADLKVPKAAVDAVIGSSIKNVGAFSDGVHVLPSKLLVQICESLTTRICSVNEVCSDRRITIKAVEHIVRSSSDKLSLVGHIIVPNQILNAHLAAFQDALDKATTPTLYTEIEAEPTLLTLIKTKLGIPSHETRFLPKAYVKDQTQHATQILDKTGYVSQSLVSEFIEPVKFAKTNGSIVLGTWIVQNKFVNRIAGEINSALQQQMYFDLRDLPLGPHLANHLVSSDTKLSKLRGNGKKYPVSYLVRPQLEREIAESVTKTLLETAPEKAQAISLDSLNGTSTLAEYVDKVPLPSLAEVQGLIPESRAPASLKIAESIWPQIRQSFRTKVTQIFEPLFEEAQLKLEASIGVYLNGVLSLESLPEGSAPMDSDLITMAWHEWQQYVSDRQYNVPSTTAIAKSQFKTSMNPYLLETRELQISKSHAKLSKAVNARKKVDGATILHLATVIYHASHFCPDGMLKIRGKAVPKLLKQFDFPESFTELKRSVKEPSAELLKSVYDDTSK